MLYLLHLPSHSLTNVSTPGLFSILLNFFFQHLTSFNLLGELQEKKEQLVEEKHPGEAFVDVRGLHTIMFKDSLEVHRWVLLRPLILLNTITWQPCERQALSSANSVVEIAIETQPPLPLYPPHFGIVKCQRNLTQDILLQCRYRPQIANSRKLFDSLLNNLLYHPVTVIIIIVLVFLVKKWV